MTSQQQCWHRPSFTRGGYILLLSLLFLFLLPLLLDGVSGNDVRITDDGAPRLLHTRPRAHDTTSKRSASEAVVAPWKTKQKTEKIHRVGMTPQRRWKNTTSDRQEHASTTADTSIGDAVVSLEKEVTDLHHEKKGINMQVAKVLEKMEERRASVGLSDKDCRPEADRQLGRLPTVCHEANGKRKLGSVTLETKVGRSGNQINQYVFAWIIAERLRWPLEFETIHWFADAEMTPVMQTQFPIFFKEIPRPLGAENITRQREERFGGMGPNPQRLRHTLQNCSPRKIAVGGYFANYNLFRGMRGYVRTHLLNWCAIESFRTPTEFMPGLPGPDDLVAHLRLGDIRDNNDDHSAKRHNPPDFHHVPAPLEYYVRLVCKSPRKRLWLAHTLGAKDFAILDKLLVQIKETCDKEVVYSTPHSAAGEWANVFEFAQYDWAVMFSAGELIMGPSSFSWWAAYLGNAETVHYPVLGHFNPKNTNSNHFQIDDDPRFVYHILQPGVPRKWDLTYDEMIASPLF